MPVHPQHKPQHRTVSASTQHLSPPFVYVPTLNVMGHGSYLMGHGSHFRWVNGSWVNSNDPLPALLGGYFFGAPCICFHISLHEQINVLSFFLSFLIVSTSVVETSKCCRPIVIYVSPKKLSTGKKLTAQRPCRPIVCRPCTSVHACAGNSLVYVEQSEESRRQSDSVRCYCRSYQLGLPEPS